MYHTYARQQERGRRHTQIQQIKALAQPLLVLQRAVGRPLLAVGRILLLRIGSGPGLATVRYDLGHACIATCVAWDVQMEQIVGEEKVNRQ